MPEYRIRAVILQQAGWWVAQCLEYDFAAVSKILEDFPELLQEAVTAQITISLERGIQPFHGFSPAPRRFWVMFEEAQTQLVAAEPLSLTARLETRTAIEARLAA